MKSYNGVAHSSEKGVLLYSWLFSVTFVTIFLFYFRYLGRMKKVLIIILFFTPLITLMSCGGESDSKSDAVVIPEGLYEKAKSMFKPQFDVAHSEINPITNEKVYLGKALYYDTRLSKEGNNSCNSCHNLKTFGVDNKPTSEGDNGGFGTRNSPTVYNAAFHTMQFWDGRAKDVEEQVGMPILNPVEMAIPSEEFLVERLSQVPEYQDLFKKAFPEDAEPLTFENISNAIAAFELTLVTSSAFDRFLADNKTALTQKQVDGLKTYLDVGCQTCHMGSQLGGTMFQKFGLYGDYRDFTNSKTNDEGKKDVTNEDADKDIFKVPGLRNISKTYPYFHDGSVTDLKDAVRIMAKVELGKDLNDTEVENIVAFLEALTGEIPTEALEIPKEAVVNEI